MRTTAPRRAVLIPPPDAAATSARRRHAALVALLGIYLVLMVWLVLWKLHDPYIGEGFARRVKWVPFVRDAAAGASAPSEVIANILLFIPFGLYLGMLRPGWGWARSSALMAGTSVVLEVAQFALAVGIADVTDVISNTAGGLIGLGLVAVSRRRRSAKALTTITRICAAGTAIVLLVIGFVFASPTHRLPPLGGGNVLVDSPGG